MKEEGDLLRIVKTRAILNIVVLALTVFVNVIAVFHPFFGESVQDISNQTKSLLVPAPYTFSIWSIIYFWLLLAFSVQLYRIFVKSDKVEVDRVNRIGPLFLFSCLLNALWLFLFQGHFFILSVLIIFALLINLILLYLKIRSTIHKSFSDSFIFKFPFSIYLAWVSVASVINTSAVLTHYSWSRYGISAEGWAGFMLVVLLVITLFVLEFRKDIFFGATICWALVGIIIERINDNGNNFIGVLDITIFSLIVILAFIIGIFNSWKKQFS